MEQKTKNWIKSIKLLKLPLVQKETQIANISKDWQSYQTFRRC